jgi:hypothetical protein
VGREILGSDALSSGFNTDVRTGERVFHVQTEDRGPAHPRIDTAVYHSGRVVHRLSTDYQGFAGSDEFSEEALRGRVHEQHRNVIESLRSGPLGEEIKALLDASAKDDQEAESAPASGIQVQLQNPDSWLSAGSVSLDLEAMIEGALRETKHSATCDENGKAKIRFPLPPLGKGDLALVIHAKGSAGNDSIRFTMRSRAKMSGSGSEQ